MWILQTAATIHKKKKLCLGIASTMSTISKTDLGALLNLQSLKIQYYYLDNPAVCEFETLDNPVPSGNVNSQNSR